MNSELMMDIAVDITPIEPKPSGVGLYVANLIKCLAELQIQENFKLRLVYQPRLKNWLRRNFDFPPSLPTNVQLSLLPIPVRISNLLLALPVNSLVSGYFENHLQSPDILHGNSYSVFPCRGSCKLMTIYDLTFIKYPDYANSVMKGYAQKIKQCLPWTDLIITISENSKREIVEYLEIDSNRVWVTPLASRYSSDYLTSDRDEQLTKLAGYDFSQPYLLFVSTIEPRKNIITLIAAFNYLKEKYKIDRHLVLIGKPGWNCQPIFQAIASSPWREQIHHFDYLSDELVALFYSKADAFVYPSYYEGFGLPVLEAMTLGTPVITSNTSSLPEVTGDAAILVNPHDATALAEAILKVISDSQLRQELIQKGQQRAKLFSWENTARETLKAYQSLLP